MSTPVAEARAPRRSFPRSSAVGVVLAVLTLILALVVYYAIVGVVALFALASALGASSQVADPPGFQATMMAVFYGGPVWALGAAIITYRVVGPSESRWARTRPADALIVIGSGLMAAALGLWPGILASDEKQSIVSMVGVGVGFALGAALASARIARSRTKGRPEVYAAT